MKEKLTKVFIIILILTNLVFITKTFGTEIADTSSDDNSSAKVTTYAENEAMIEQNEKLNNNRLKNLEVDGFEISPEFNSFTYTYYVTVPKNTKEVNIRAEKDDDNATLSGKFGIQKLKSDETSFNINVTARSGLTSTYTLIVTRLDEGNAKLKNIQIENSESFTPKFDKDIYYYEAKVKQANISSLGIKAEPEKSSEKVTIIGNEENNLKEGENLITILVQEGTDTNIYQVNVTIEKGLFDVPTKDEGDKKQSFMQNFSNEIKKFLNKYENLLPYILGAIIVIILLIIISAKSKKSKNKNKRKR